MATPDGLILPKPGIPKTLGVLNIIFAVILGLWGLYLLVATAFGPQFLAFFENIAKNAQAQVEAQQKVQIQQFDAQEAQAKTEPEKAAIRQRRDAFIASQPRVQVNAMDAAKDTLNDPVIWGYGVTSAATGLLLTLLLLIAGIGLVRLTASGIKLGMAWGILQIAQIVILLAVNLALVQPKNQVHVDKQLATLKAEAERPNPNPGAAAAYQVTKMTADAAVPIAIVLSLVGMIYPLLTLILLSRPGAKAACLSPKPPAFDDFGPKFSLPGQ